MINSRKKGFTLVELVIVIAVVAVLAAVLIPTFSSLVKKANTANDTVVAKNMNTALAEYTALNGKPENFDEVLEAIEEAGYVLANLNAKAEGNLYGWDEKNNQIVYIDKEGNTIYQNVEFIKDDVKFVIKNATEKPSWAGNFDVVDMSKPEGPKALIGALEAGISVSLVKDITDLDTAIIIKDTVTINLNNHTLSTIIDKTQTDTDGASKHFYAIDNKGNLTIENGTIETRGIYNRAGATLTIKENVTIKALDAGGGACINVKGGTVNIDGAKLITNAGDFADSDAGWNPLKYEPSVVVVYDGVVNIKNATLESTQSGAYALNVRGGKVTVENSTITAWRGVVYSTNGSEVILNGGTYKRTDTSNAGYVLCEDGGTITNNGGQIIE